MEGAFTGGEGREKKKRLPKPRGGRILEERKKSKNSANSAKRKNREHRNNVGGGEALPAFNSGSRCAPSVLLGILEGNMKEAASRKKEPKQGTTITQGRSFEET